MALSHSAEFFETIAVTCQNLHAQLYRLEERIEKLERHCEERVEQLEYHSPVSVHAEAMGTDHCMEVDQPDVAVSGSFAATGDLKIEESQEILPEDNSELRTRQYALEENLYGYVMAFPTQWISPFLLFIYYNLVIGISFVISLGVASNWSSSMTDLKATCSKDGDMWDCRPPGYTTLESFATLDVNADGLWSVVEARDAGLLRQFRGLHEMALGTPKFLNMIMPFKQAEINQFCYLWWGNLNPLQLLNVSEAVQMVKVSGYLTDRILSLCAAERDEENQFLCYFNYICPSETSSSSAVEAAPAQTGADQYMEATAHLTKISLSLHGSLLTNLLRPCRIVDPDLCSNAEVGDVLEKIPMWEGLNPEDRVTECVAYVKSSCSQLFGNDYSRFQLGLRQTCGMASYSPGELGASPAMKSFILMRNPTCKDNETLVRVFAKRWVEVNPTMYFLLAGVERLQKLPKDYLISNLTCDVGAALNFCSDTAGIVNPDDNRKFVTAASLFGQTCPATCCRLNSYGCPPPCLLWNTQIDTSFGSITCSGSACRHIEIEGQSASLMMMRTGGYGAREAARLVIRSELSLQLHIRSMHVGDKLDVFCSGGYVEVDKVRYCSGNAPEYVQIRRRLGGMVELEWLSEDSCANPDCGWNLLIVEAGESESYTVSVVSYDNVERFHDDLTGVVTFIYGMFFALVLFIWTGYIMMEFKKACSYFECVCFHPTFAGQIRIAMVVGVCLPRMAIALWVFGVGVVLLISSTSYIDIVLNGVALAFILDIDEYLYEITFRDQDRQMVSKADIFTWPCNLYCRKARTLNVYMCLGLAVIITVIQYTWNFGYNLESDGLRCACALSGATCSDAVLGSSN